MTWTPMVMGKKKTTLQMIRIAQVCFNQSQALLGTATSGWKNQIWQRMETIIRIDMWHRVIGPGRKPIKHVGPGRKSIKHVVC
ncbi:hypothetical protein POPTR_016G011250v4 [Populus trichocarpa]|uniref:Uncharacterized protein n=1 Tax=Populus trichocarpa TaxID=3694 RepID=A0ACC0RS67_POPTR|nr:hypothetical protein BDE02_16G010300 [Populus trichocarpa]KAI9379958.1 hypothetical protein POPTR_016G011250v4 [Populus trichocarpa]